MLQNFLTKIDFVLIIGIIASLIPIWNQLDKILQAERATAAKQAEIQISIEFIQQRLDRIDNLIAQNSSFGKN